MKFSGPFLVLCLALNVQAAESTLNWGTTLSHDTDKTSAIYKYQARVLEVAKSLTQLSFKAEKEILSEGKLPTDPGVAESKKVVAEIPEIYTLSLCSRLARETVQKQACQKAATQGILAWANSYVPTGNPINESLLIPLMKAWDLLNPLLSTDDNKILNKFAHEIIAAGDNYYKNLNAKSDKAKNNWGTWRLAIRAITAQVIGEDDLIKTSKNLLADHISENIKPDGASIDFEIRDALHYHIYDVEAYLELASILPLNYLTLDEMGKIKSAVLFLRPYYKGEKTHIEFVKSKVAFDIKRKNAKLEDYQNAPWKPSNARKILRLARVVFPDIKTWTQDLVDEHYDPTLKLFAAGHDD